MYDLEVGWELRVFITVSLFLRNFEKNKLSTAAAKCSCLPCPTTMTKINTPELDICKVGPPPQAEFQRGSMQSDTGLSTSQYILTSSYILTSCPPIHQSTWAHIINSIHRVDCPADGRLSILEALSLLSTQRRWKWGVLSVRLSISVKHCFSTTKLEIDGSRENMSPFLALSTRPSCILNWALYHCLIVS